MSEELTDYGKAHVERIFESLEGNPHAEAIKQQVHKGLHVDEIAIAILAMAHELRSAQ